MDSRGILAQQGHELDADVAAVTGDENPHGVRTTFRA